MRRLLVPAAALPIFVLLARPAALQQQRSSVSSDVVFIGTNHNLAFLHPGFSPAHIRALLSHVDPAALCLELKPDWPRADGIPTFPQEQYAALTWAERTRIPVFGVDWETPAVRALPPIRRMADAVALLDSGDQFRRFREEYVATAQWTAGEAFGEAPDDLESFQRQNLPLTVDRWPKEDSADTVRDDRIADNIRAVVTNHPGQRVAIVFGSYHYLPLKRRLESTQNIRVLPPLRYLPLDTGGLTRGWHPDDAVLLLGANLDDWRSIASPQSRNHQRTKELLDRLRHERPNSVITRYYEARWRMLFGDLNESRRVLRQIVDDGGTTGLPYVADTRWSWPPLRTFELKARFYLAAANDLAGDHVAAARDYRQLLSLPQQQLVVRALWPETRVDLRPYIESLIREPYRGGLFEAYRASLAMGR